MIGKSGRGCVSGKALVRLRWLWAPGEVFSKREQARGVGAEAQRPESDAPLVVRCFLERHIFAGEHGAQEDPVVPPAEVAPSLHAAQFGGGGVLENGQPPRKRSGRGRVVARGRRVGERFVRAAVVERLPPLVEALLLRPERSTGGARRLRFQGAMHALVGAVLLRHPLGDALRANA